MSTIVQPLSRLSIRVFQQLLKQEGNTLYLPLRPILLGGDDLTFVCDGRLGLELATTALDCFTNATLPHIEGTVRACAGVALVKTHTPFSRAYDLAEDLSRSAKTFLKDAESYDKECALDWHVGFSNPTESLTELRRRQYNVFAEETPGLPPQLTCRPYRLGQLRQTEPEAGTWAWLAGTVLGTQGDGFHAAWVNHRSKLKDLREIVREGKTAVSDALEAWQVPFPDIRLPEGMQDGFRDEGSPVLDAMELLDLHWPLETNREAA